MNIKQLETLGQTLTTQQIKEQMKHTKKYNAFALVLLADTQDVQVIDYAIEYKEDGEILRIYFGLAGLGIIANYDAINEEWYKCYSHGNCGYNWASGGTWSSGKAQANAPTLLAHIAKTLN